MSISPNGTKPSSEPGTRPIGPNRILLIRLKSIGDILFTLPAVNLLRDQFSEAGISFLTSQEHASILRGFAALDEVLVLDRALYRQFKPVKILRTTTGLMGQLRRAKFDLVIDFQGYGETGLLARLTGARERWGSVYRRGRAWAYTRGLERSDDVHPIDWNLSLLRQCGVPDQPIRNEFRLPDEELEAARQFYSRHKLDPDKPTVFIQPLTSSPQKDWPLSNYLVLAQALKAKKIQVLFGGGPSDRPRLAPMLEAGFPVAAGTPLLVTAGLARLSSLIVGGDTGVLHLAVAMGRRVLALMQPCGEGSAIPFGHRDWVLEPEQPGNVADIDLPRVTSACLAAVEEADRMLS